MCLEPFDYLPFANFNFAIIKRVFFILYTHKWEYIYIKKEKNICNRNLLLCTNHNQTDNKVCTFLLINL